VEGSKRKERTFVVDEINPETGEVDRGAVMAALQDMEAVGHRLGGAFGSLRRFNCALFAR